MRRRQLCELRISLAIEATGPLLIKSGEERLTGPDMTFVRTRRGGTEEPYLPGTSLKGAFRAQAERLVRTLGQADRPGVCLPYDFASRSEMSCGKRLEKVARKSRAKAYARSCPACRTFGSLVFAGRVRVRDAYLDGPYEVEVRHGVAIDRYTGGAARRAKFEVEVLTSGRFKTEIVLDNFELWQVGMLAAVLADLRDERLPLGMGASRGLGNAKGTIESAEVIYVGRSIPESFVGIERLVGEEERERYALFVDPRVEPAKLPEGNRDGLGVRFDLGETFWEAVKPAIAEFRECGAGAKLE